jgi:hypothetical protein
LPKKEWSSSRRIEQLEKENSELESHFSCGNLNPHNYRKNLSGIRRSPNIEGIKRARWLELSEIEE